jgi:hypothetical protein
MMKEWGRKFYYTILGDNDLIETFFLAREVWGPHMMGIQILLEVEISGHCLALIHGLELKSNLRAKDITATQEWIKKNK